MANSNNCCIFAASFVTSDVAIFMAKQVTVRLKCTFDDIPHDKGSKWCSLEMQSIVDESHMHRYKTCSVYYDEISIASIENGGNKTNYNIYERFNTIF